MPRLSIRVAANGLPAQITWEGGPEGGALSGPSRLLLSAEDGKKVLLVPPLVKASPHEWVVVWEEQQIEVRVTYGTGTDPDMSFKVESFGSKARTVGLILLMEVKSEADRGFFPAGSGGPAGVSLGEHVVAYDYGRVIDNNALDPLTEYDLALPLASVYSSSADWGLALFGEQPELIPRFGVQVNRQAVATTVRVLFPGLNCKPGEEVARGLYVRATRGDWRPALAADLARFPQVFELQNPGVITALAGPFVSSGGTPPDSTIAEWYAQGLRVLEIHGTYPLSGMFVPDHEPFVPRWDDAYHFLKAKTPIPALLPPPNASWRELREFVEKDQKPTMTLDAVRDYIRRLHKQGIKGLIYFDPTEPWAPWAAAEFPNDRIVGADGNPVYTWYDNVEMIPDKHRPWGKYILDQVRRLLEIYQDVDGVFFDESALGGHDLTELCTEACRMVRAQGKICWWNGPYSAELAALADGMMTEGGGTDRYKIPTGIIQYYGLAGKPIVSLGPATPEAYRYLLASGVIPAPVAPSERQLGEQWFPLFKWLHGSRWVLDAHALNTDPRLAANIYRAKDGSYTVPLVPRSEGPSSPGAGAGFEVRVRVTDGEDVKFVYLLQPDPSGYQEIPFQRVEGTIVVKVPELKYAGLLVLARRELRVTPQQ
jgi:hypothetical protein